MDNIEFLEAIKKGINPFTGEIISEASFLRAPDVIGRFEEIIVELKKSDNFNLIYTTKNIEFLETINAGIDPVTGLNLDSDDPLRVDYVVECLNEIANDYKFLLPTNNEEFNNSPTSEKTTDNKPIETDSNTLRIEEPYKFTKTTAENTNSSHKRKRKKIKRISPNWQQRKYEQHSFNFKFDWKEFGGVILLLAIIAIISVAIILPLKFLCWDKVDAVSFYRYVELINFCC